MQLSVGAVSRRVIEEAAKLQVSQIIASRRQVEGDRGYTGLNQKQLVELVAKLSKKKTQVARDHGGPNMGWDEDKDEGLSALDDDVTAGFKALHIDVSKLRRTTQLTVLLELYERYREYVEIEVGGEHDPWLWNMYLAFGLSGRPDWVVLNTGAYVWNDRQKGRLMSVDQMRECTRMAHMLGVKTKAHNWDWVYRHEYFHQLEMLDGYNLAPELAAVEIDALMQVMTFMQTTELLDVAFCSNQWQRWFRSSEGTWYEHARCAARYVLNDPRVLRLKLTSAQEDYVRRRIRDAIKNG